MKGEDRKERGRWVLGALVMEALVWYGAAAAFLAVYVYRHAGPSAAVLAHLELLTLIVAGLACLRLVACLWLPWVRAARWVGVLAIGGTLAVLLSYYALVLAGLQSWGRVITWNLIRTYAGQGLDLAAALGYPPAALFAAAGVLLAILLALMLFVANWSDWTAVVARGGSARLVSVVAVAGLALVTLRLYAFAIDPSVHSGEPVSLTFYPEPAQRLHNNRTGNSSLLDAGEDNVRNAYLPATAFRPRNVILIVGDALRPDRMSIYGHSRPTTPHIERWGGVATSLRKFDRVWAACAESPCGLLAMASGRYVHELPQRPLLLPEVLRRHGYRYHMILGGDHTNFYGLREAYGEMDSYFDGSQASGFYMNDDALVVDRAAALPEWDGKPVMIQFHLMSTHELGSRRAEALRFQPSAPYSGLGHWSRSGPDPRATNFYDNGVVQFDMTVDRILGHLQRKGYLAETLVVITADHGDMLGEHGTFGHGRSLHEQELRLPLLLLSFGYRPEGQVDPLVVASQADIAPTILTEFDIPRPATWTGRPLQERPRREVLHFQQQSMVGLLDLREGGRYWKYWTDLRSGEEFAFDLAVDPGERRNQVEQAPATLRRDWRKRISVVAVSSAR